MDSTSEWMDSHTPKSALCALRRPGERNRDALLFETNETDGFFRLDNFMIDSEFLTPPRKDRLLGAASRIVQEHYAVRRKMRSHSRKESIATSHRTPGRAIANDQANILGKVVWRHGVPIESTEIAKIRSAYLHIVEPMASNLVHYDLGPWCRVFKGEHWAVRSFRSPSQEYCRQSRPAFQNGTVGSSNCVKRGPQERYRTGPCFIIPTDNEPVKKRIGHFFACGNGFELTHCGAKLESSYPSLRRGLNPPGDFAQFYDYRNRQLGQLLGWDRSNSGGNCLGRPVATVWLGFDPPYTTLPVN